MLNCPVSLCTKLTIVLVSSSAVRLPGEPLPERAGGGHQEAGRPHYQSESHGCPEQQDGRVPVRQAHHGWQELNIQAKSLMPGVKTLIETQALT